MPGVEECLFSLELVVEKLYIPHITCRFPSVAFRLLDFPTIVINHVEDDLGKAIRRNISLDSDYTISEQFAELKDKHGNFMIKKGKSCLFKMAAETLKNHLSSTPLYVMVIDMFPETPTLVGNSTVPLNDVTNAICADLIRLGSSVPSVHGDKGLFKIYNLMGKELGYFVLGFRLVCLGPSLIPHLPEATLVPRLNKKQAQKRRLKNEQIVEMMQLSQDDAREDDGGDEAVEMKTTGSMTDVVKQDALIQTVEIDDKAVHVQIQETSVFPAPVNPPSAAKMVKDCTTQTKKKSIKTALNAKKKILEDLVAMQEHDDNDEVFVTNIICPPPLFYNSEAMPPVELNNDNSSIYTDISASDKLTVESLTDEEVETGDMPARKEFDQKEHLYQSMGKIVPPPPPISYQDTPLNVVSNKEQRKRTPGQVSNKEQSHKVALQSGAVFPLLNALMNELLCIQNPSVFQNIQFQMPSPMFASSSHAMPGVPQLPRPEGLQGVLRMDKAHTTANRAQPEHAVFNMGAMKEKTDGSDGKNIFGRQERKSHSKCGHPHPGVPKEKSWLRSVPEYTIRRSKLTFGLTNTQRLRLQKANPEWLTAMEGAKAVRRSSKQLNPSKQYSQDEFNTTSLSDTLTEVRRQAQKELEQTAADDTLRSGCKLPSTPLLTPKKDPNSRGRSSPKKHTSSKSKAVSGSPKGQKKDQHIHPCKNSSAREKQSEETVTPADRDKNHDAATGDTNEHLVNTASDVRSSSRSIEVRIPFVPDDAAHDDVSEPAISDSDEESDIPLPDDSYRGDRKMPSKFGFPDYLRQDRSLPDPIAGQLNCSLNTTSGVDENSPLESTRNSKHYSSEYKNSKIMRSTDDFDTKQFPSCSEPELQGLVTDDEEEQDDMERYKQQNVVDRFPVVNPMLSQQSPVPSMRHSVVKLDLSKSQIPLTPKKDDSTPLSSRSESPKRPTPRPRRPGKDLRDSAHTDSISSYMPSDPDNAMVSISSGDGNYSDDFQDLTALSKLSSEKPRIIPSTLLGYTIH